MKCYTAIKTLLIGLGVTSFSLCNCMQSTDIELYSSKRTKSSRSMQVFNAAKQDTSVVVHINDPVQATLMQIAEFAKSGQTDLTELVSKDVLLEAMQQKPRLWGTHLKCLYVGRGLREGDRNTELAKGLYEYYKDNLKWSRTSEEEISFLGKFLRSSKIKEFEYPAKTPSKENSDYRYYDIVKDENRVMIEFRIQDGNGVFTPSDYQNRLVRLILDHEELARVCTLHLSGNVDINEHGQTLVCLGHAGQQIGMVNQVKQQNAELISQAEDLSKQIAEEKERKESLAQQVRELQKEKREAEEKSASLMQQVEELRASNSELSMQLDATEQQHAERETIMFSQLRDLINAMIDGVEFADDGINELCHSSSMDVQFWKEHGLVLTDGEIGVTLLDLFALTKQAREADRRQMSINSQHQSCQRGGVGGYYGLCGASQHMSGESSQQQYHSVAAQSQQYSMSVQPQYWSGTFMQQQPQHSQDITMSIPRQGGPLQDANYPAYQQQTYNSVSVQPQQYGMSVQPQYGRSAFMQQQPQHSQGVTMSVSMPNVAQQ